MFDLKFIIPLIAFLGFADSSNAADCTHAITDAQRAEFNRYISARESNYSSAEASLRMLLSSDPNNFCLNYEIGRLHVIHDQPDRALDVLSKAKKIANTTDLSNQPIHNIIGYIYLSEEKLEEAAVEFQKQVEIPEFSNLPQQDRMKVHNNYGLTLMRLDRYQEALGNFDKAISLGSSFARKNRAIVTSILEVQNASKKGIPGIFAVAIYSTREQKKVPLITKRLADQFNVNPNEFQAFRRPNGMMTITYGAHLSYPDAEANLRELNNLLSQSGRKLDAHIVSVADWKGKAMKY